MELQERTYKNTVKSCWANPKNLYKFVLMLMEHKKY